MPHGQLLAPARVPRRTRRLLLLLAVLAGATPAAGCGGDDAPARTRTLTTASGPVTAPAEPRRILADHLAVDALTALDFPRERIVGTAYLPTSAYMADRFDSTGIPDVGTAAGPLKVEKIAALQPDLIIAGDGEDYYGQLAAVRRIAPVVGLETLDWRAHLRGVAAAVGLQAKGEQVIKNTEAEIATIAARLDDKGGPVRVSVLEPNPNTVLMYDKQSGPGVATLTEVGFELDPQVGEIDPGNPYPEISSEQLGRFEDNRLWFLKRNLVDRDYFKQPIWQRLAPLAQGRTVDFDSHWGYGGVLAVDAVLADIEKAIALL